MVLYLLGLNFFHLFDWGRLGMSHLHVPFEVINRGEVEVTNRANVEGAADAHFTPACQVMLERICNPERRVLTEVKALSPVSLPC